MSLEVAVSFCELEVQVVVFGGFNYGLGLEIINLVAGLGVEGFHDWDMIILGRYWV